MALSGSSPSAASSDDVLASVLRGDFDLADRPVVVSDPQSRTALFGRDVVAYYTDGRAVMGQQHLVHRWAGADWRFASEANLERFRSDPAAFMPMLGGHDPLRMVSSHLAFGDPDRFLVRDGHLWLFRDEASEAEFLADSSLASAAIAAWKLILPIEAHGRIRDVR